LSAAIAYMQTGGDRKHVAALIKQFGETPLSEMTQAKIDEAAGAYSHLSPRTQTLYVYTPVSAIMHRALGKKCPVIKRPQGSKGRVVTDFLWPDDAFAVIDAADEIDPEFGLYLIVLLYTGVRKSEGLDLLAADTKPAELAVWLRDSKNGDPRMLQLREDIAARLQKHLEGHSGERLFRFKDGGHFKHLLLRAKLKVCGMSCPKRRPTGWKPPEHRLKFVTFHTFRHTWASWMRFYGGVDVKGLAGTGNWRDERSASRYAHVVPRQEWSRVNSLPGLGNRRGKAVNE
jgi:integrase